MMIRRLAAAVTAFALTAAAPYAAAAQSSQDPDYNLGLRCTAVLAYVGVGFQRAGDTANLDDVLKAMKRIRDIQVLYGRSIGLTEAQIDADAKAVTADRIQRLYGTNVKDAEGREVVKNDYNECVARRLILVK